MKFGAAIVETGKAFLTEVSIFSAHTRGVGWDMGRPEEGISLINFDILDELFKRKYSLVLLHKANK